MGIYGDKVAITPNIDGFFSDPGSTIYSNAYCQVAWYANLSFPSFVFECNSIEGVLRVETPF
jgi:hypothetical protein